MTVATVFEVVLDPLPELALEEALPWEDDVPVAVVWVVWPKAREYVVAELTEPVAAIVAMTSPCLTVLVRYCVAVVVVERWLRNHQPPPARTHDQGDHEPTLHAGSCTGRGWQDPGSWLRAG